MAGFDDLSEEELDRKIAEVDGQIQQAINQQGGQKARSSIQLSGFVPAGGSRMSAAPQPGLMGRALDAGTDVVTGLGNAARDLTLAVPRAVGGAVAGVGNAAIAAGGDIFNAAVGSMPAGVPRSTINTAPLWNSAAQALHSTVAMSPPGLVAGALMAPEQRARAQAMAGDVRDPSRLPTTEEAANAGLIGIGAVMPAMGVLERQPMLDVQRPPVEMWAGRGVREGGLQVPRIPRSLDQMRPQPAPPGPIPLLGPAPIYAGPVQEAPLPGAPAQLPPPPAIPQLPPSRAELAQRQAIPGAPLPGTILGAPPDIIHGLEYGNERLLKTREEVPQPGIPLQAPPPVFPRNPPISLGDALSGAGPALDVVRPPPGSPPLPAASFWREDTGVKPAPERPASGPPADTPVEPPSPVRAAKITSEGQRGPEVTPRQFEGVREGGGAVRSRPQAGRARDTEGVPQDDVRVEAQPSGVRGGSGGANAGPGVVTKLPKPPKRLNLEARLPNRGIIDRMKNAAIDWMRPEFNEFFTKLGLPEQAHYVDIDGTTNYRRAVEGTAGSLENLEEMKDAFTKDPQLSDALIAQREGKALTKQEYAALQNADPDVVQYAQNVFEYLDDVRQNRIPKWRDAGLDVGDLGEKYVPRSTQSIGELIGNLGPDFRKQITNPDAPVSAKNLLGHRIGEETPKGSNLAMLFADYAKQVEGLDAKLSLSSEVQRAIAHYEKNPATQPEARAIREYWKAVEGEAPDVDQEASAARLREIAEANDAQPGLKVDSAGKWLPKGQVEVLREGSLGPKGKMFHIAVDGVEQRIPVSESAILAEKYGGESLKSPFSKAVNKINRGASILGVGGKLSTFGQAFADNVGRLGAAAEAADVKPAMEAALRDYRDPARLQRLRDLKLVADIDTETASEGAIENLGSKLGKKIEGAYFADVTLPDNVIKPVIFHARLAKILRENPGMDVDLAEKRASWETGKYADMYSSAFKNAASRTILGKLIQAYSQAPMKVWSLLAENLEKADWSNKSRLHKDPHFQAFAKQFGVKVAKAAVVAGMYKTADEFLKDLLGDVPVAGALFNGRKSVGGMPTLDILISEARNIGKFAVGKGTLRSTMPSSVKQFIPEGK